MPLKSTPRRYGAIAATIHWLSALAVILMLISGMVMGNEDDLVPAILPIHVSLGIVVGVLTLFRIAWWVFFDRHPEPVAGMSRAQEWAARLVHLGLYGAIVIMVASGVGMVALTGAAPAIFAGGPLPEFDEVPPYLMHGIMSRILIALVLGHIGAALFHQFIRRDGLIGRMRVGG
ncbi:cytochrome b [Devosia sediminis]|uniref:Cytochrome b n=1 Tax=Devosia sediminis TaxID=2798801 RepID=A0A934J2F6_9HYPH|nr:cytochrome b/b6 domain-containing protein [Devosia sediminis]MBJ3786530.1 cytochrome b [Devosia sediminis]